MSVPHILAWAALALAAPIAPTLVFNPIEDSAHLGVPLDKLTCTPDSCPLPVGLLSKTARSDEADHGCIKRPGYPQPSESDSLAVRDGGCILIDAGEIYKSTSVSLVDDGCIQRPGHPRPGQSASLTVREGGCIEESPGPFDSGKWLRDEVQLGDNESVIACSLDRQCWYPPTGPCDPIWDPWCAEAEYGYRSRRPPWCPPPII